ncbi:unnamed protein product, partial [marine sediment metagenome]
NFLPLLKLAQGPEARRISIRGATVTLQLPQRQELLRLDVQDLQFVAGRVERLGRVTMSAVLDPDGCAAPISLNVALGASEEAAADVDFSFTGLDLARLELPTLLRLPLRRLHGRCNGSLGLRVNHEGYTERFRFDLNVFDLDVQPSEGPELRVIEKAHLRIDAATDLVRGQIDIQSASVLLPGVRLAGRAKMSLDVLEGNWEAVESIDVSGEVHPGQIAGLLSGGAALPGGLAVVGPVDVALSARRDGARVRIGLTADATAAALHRDGREIKPAGRALLAELAGTLDERNWDLTIERASPGQLRLGRNVAQIWGTLGDLRRLTNSWREPSLSVFQRASQSLALLDCQGTWVLTDLESLGDLSPSLAAALESVVLRGVIRGRWHVAPADEADVHAEARLYAPAETALRIGAGFVKPLGRIASLRLAGDIDAGQSSVRNAELELSIGAGSVVLGPARLAVSGADEETLVFDGPLKVEHVQDLVTCLPQWPDLGV